MINTKLILVDGIPGSGKSTISHFIARQLNKNGIKAKWYLEGENDHPLYIVVPKDGESVKDHCLRVIKVYTKLWKSFVKKIEKENNCVYVMECIPFQHTISYPHFGSDIDKNIMKKHSHNICNIAKRLNPVIIHFHNNNIKKALMLNWERRGDGFKNWIYYLVTNSAYFKNHNLKNDKGVINYYKDYYSLTSEIYNELNYKKLQIDNSKQKWNDYRKEILKFLQLEEKKENLFFESFNQYCGEYLGKGFVFKIHIKNNRLCLDAFWPNLKLISVSKNEFEIEGYPVTLKFYKYGGKNKLKVIKSRSYYKEGEIAEKYTPLKINRSILENYCGTYWCEKGKLERKIILKNGKLYYWREKGSESELVTIKKTEFMMMARVENMLEFKKVNNEWQFNFDVKGDKPSTSLFVKKK